MTTKKEIILCEFSVDELTEKIVRKFQSFINQDVPNQKRKLILNLDELSLEYSIPKATIYAWTSGRKIPFVKKGKRIYFNREKIEKWLMEGERAPLSNDESSNGQL